MEIYINRDGEQHGPYTLEDARAHLAAGQLQAEDLAWHEGLAEWTTLGELAGAPDAAADPGANVDAPTKSKATLIVRIVLGVVLLTVGVLAGLDHLARGKYLSANEYLDAEYAKSRSASPEEVATELGRKPASHTEENGQVTEIYEWKSPMRIYRIQVVFDVSPGNKNVSIDSLTPKMGWRWGGKIEFENEGAGEGEAVGEEFGGEEEFGAEPGP